MAAPRPTTPIVILVMGVLAVAFFGGTVVYMTDKTPILRLQPELERLYGAGGFATRFVPDSPPRIEIDVPRGLVRDEHSLGDVAVVALLRYRELANPTQVMDCVARVAGDPHTSVHVPFDLASQVATARAAVAEIGSAVGTAGLPGAVVEVPGPSLSGAFVRVRGRAERDAAATIARRAVAAVVGSFAFVGHVDVAVQTEQGEVTRRGGRDAPR